MVDPMASIAEDYLIESFQFKIPPGASYVTDRRAVSYFTSGSNIYTSNGGTKVIRINWTGDGWLDPGSIRLHYTLANTDSTLTNNLRTIGGPWSFFRRARCLIGGALVDDDDYYNRVHEMVHILTTNNNRDNDDSEGFGYRWDSRGNYLNYDNAHLPGIASGASINTCFKPLLGLFTQIKLSLIHI